MADFVETEAEWKEWEKLGNHYYALGKSADANECWAIADRIRGMTDSDKAMIIAKLWQAKKEGKFNE